MDLPLADFDFSSLPNFSAATVTAYCFGTPYLSQPNPDPRPPAPVEVLCNFLCRPGWSRDIKWSAQNIHFVIFRSPPLLRALEFQAYLQLLFS